VPARNGTTKKLFGRCDRVGESAKLSAEVDAIGRWHEHPPEVELNVNLGWGRKSGGPNDSRGSLESAKIDNEGELGRCRDERVDFVVCQVDPDVPVLHAA